MKIGIIREGKVPPDHRMALVPWQCRQLAVLHPTLDFLVQQSEIRCIPDERFAEADLKLTDAQSIREADILFGIKEVPVHELISDKTYFFFSHTIKQQIYNRDLLRAILAKKITLIDYECLTDELGSRVVAFGRFAGIVGAYNGILAYGKRFNLFDLKPAYQCSGLREMKEEFQKLRLPPVKIVVTGTGRVGKGAKELLDLMRIKQVFPQEFTRDRFNEPVYTILRSENYYTPKNEEDTDNLGFYSHPESYQSDFWKFAEASDIFISGHYWNPKADVLFTAEQMRSPEFKIRVVADVTCDILGSIPCTLRSSKITEPCYDYNPETGLEEPAFSHGNNITVMAVDNLPCELPADASEAFGEQLMQYVFPALLNGDRDSLLARATITKVGKLTERYQYLQDFVDS